MVIGYAPLKCKVLNLPGQACSASALQPCSVSNGPFLTPPVITYTRTHFTVFETRELEMGLPICWAGCFYQ